MLSWFPVDIYVRNDGRLRSVRRRFGMAGVGHLLELWSYVASEGSKTDHGRGVRRDGTPLPIDDMAEDCHFASVDDFRAFAEHLADIGHIDPCEWHERGIIFLPAMARRLEAYRLSKGRQSTGRGPGRPRKTSGNTPGIITDRGTGGPEQSTSAISPEVPVVSTGSKTAGNSGVIQGNSGNAKVPLHSSSDLILQPTESEDQDLLGDLKRLTPKKLMALWNEHRKPGPKCLALTNARAEKMRNRIKETPDADDWIRAILFLNTLPWANAGGNGDKPDWRADLDYLIRPGKVNAALERLAAKDLPRAKVTGAAAGRVTGTPGKYARIAAEQDE